MSSALVLPRASLAWLLLSILAVIIPHARHLPPWVLLVMLAVFVWRIQIHRGIWQIPRRWSKLALALIFVVGLKFQYGSLLSLEPMVALLIISLILKLLEMYRSRDAMSVVLLGFFTTATQFLFGQSIFEFIYGFFCFLLLVATLVSLNQGTDTSTSRKTFPLAVKLTLQCIPIMLVFFFLFPRIGSLWTVPLPQNSSTTGVSDTMSPGDISKLTQDGGKAFTVSFDGEIPPNRNLYWRGIVFSDFDGRTWSISRWGTYPASTIVKWRDNPVRSDSLNWYDEAEELSDPITYTIILEPTYQPWLFALPLADVKLRDSGLTRDFTVINQIPIAKRISYRAQSTLKYKIDPVELPNWYRSRNLELPDGYNPTTVATAAEWAGQAQNTQQLIDRFLAMIAKDFTYTLEPPALGRNTVDEFLWQTKKGFCEHFASAFVVFMRAAGVPARVVAGYQGGELIEDFLQVSQADAHAWAEVWIEHQGWVRVDPTAAIAPERIERGIRSVFARSVSNPLSMEAYRHIDLMNRLRLQMDVVSYRWQRWVLNYNSDKQQGLLQRLLGKTNWWNAGMLLITSVAVILASITFMVWVQNRPRRRTKEMQLFDRFCRQCRKRGLVRQKRESARAFISRVASIYPEKSPQLMRILQLFERSTYQADSDATDLLHQEITQFTLGK